MRCCQQKHRGKNECRPFGTRLGFRLAPGTAVPGFHISSLRDWSLFVHSPSGTSLLTQGAQECWKDFFLVYLQRLLFLPAHEINVELRHSGFGQRF